MTIGETGVRSIGEDLRMRKTIVIADICLLLLLGLTPLIPRPSAGDDLARVGVHQHLGAGKLGADRLLHQHAEVMRVP